MVVLKKYVGDKQNLQLEILYACQITVAKLNHPPRRLETKRLDDKQLTPPLSLLSPSLLLSFFFPSLSFPPLSLSSSYSLPPSSLFLLFPSLSHTELLPNIFHILYDLELVDEATFLEWRDRGKEGFGKGNAVHSLTNFYACLDLLYPESDSDL